jgi:hypothetical protein
MKKAATKSDVGQVSLPRVTSNSPWWGPEDKLLIHIRKLRKRTKNIKSRRGLPLDGGSAVA